MDDIKTPKRTSFVIMSDGTIYSADVAARVGLCLRDRFKPGNIFVGEVSAPAKLFVESGTMDQEAADFILSLDQARQPASGPMVNTNPPPAPKAAPPSAAEQQFVDALGVFLTSPMQAEDRARFVEAFRSAVTSATAKGR